MKVETSQPEFELVTPSRQDKFVLHWWLQERGYSCCNGNSLSDYDYSILKAFCLSQVKFERVSYLIKKLPPKPKPIVKKQAETVYGRGTDDGYDLLRDLYGQRIKTWYRR